MRLPRFMPHAQGPATLCLALLWTAALTAQEPASAVPHAATAPVASGGPVLQPSPLTQWKALEPPADEEYTLGGGDEISVEVPGHPELSGKHLVGPDGRITLPTAGTVNLSGLTREQASEAVQKAYAQYYRDPSASVGIEKYGSNRVLVLGAVQHQGYVYFEQTPTLLEAITQAGLLQPAPTQPGVQPVAVATAKLAPPPLPQDCRIYRGSGDNQQVVTVNLQKMLATGTSMADLRLRRNDVVFVPNPKDRYVSVLGEVGHPGPVILTEDLNLPTVLGLAGGLTERAGNNPTLTIVDPASGKTRTIKYKEISTLQGMNEVGLKPGDLIYVPRAGLSKFGYVVQQISPISTLASVASIAAF